MGQIKETDRKRKILVFSFGRVFEKDHPKVEYLEDILTFVNDARLFCPKRGNGKGKCTVFSTSGCEKCLESSSMLMSINSQLHMTLKCFNEREEFTTLKIYYYCEKGLQISFFVAEYVYNFIFHQYGEKFDIQIQHLSVDRKE